MLRRTFAALVAGILFVPLPAFACGGLFCQNTPVDQAGEKILFATDGQSVTAHVQIQYKGAAKDFSWVVPVPTAPTLDVGTDNLFTTLRTATRPTFRLNIEDEPGCELPPMMEDAMAGPAPTVQKGDDGGVMVVSQQQVGPYDSAVLTADDPGALKKWLKDNEYVLPPKLDPLLDPYVAGKYYFVALKLTKDKDAGDIQPIVLKYASTKPGIPIRLTGVAATADMDVFVWVLARHRAIPENYRHAIINEARIDWLSGGSNYRDVVTAAMNEAGGQAFVTDFAGDSSVVAPATFDESRFHLDQLAQLSDPVEFAQAVVNNGFFGERSTGVNSEALVGFLKRYIPKPAAVQEDDTSFYRFIENHREALQGVKVDTAKAVAELREKVVKPYGELESLFAASPYLTAMYTTMSPEEMTQDPMFVLNADLPEVSSKHEAKGIRRCSQAKSYFDAPIDVTLASGKTFRIQPPRYENGVLVPDAALQAQPAALRVEQLKAAGGPSLIADNSTRTTPSVVPAPSARAGSNGGPSSSTSQPGFGCAGCAARTGPPATGANAGEGVAYALVFLGFLGYRKFNSRR